MSVKITEEIDEKQVKYYRNKKSYQNNTKTENVEGFLLYK